MVWGGVGWGLGEGVLFSRECQCLQSPMNEADGMAGNKDRGCVQVCMGVEWVEAGGGRDLVTGAWKSSKTIIDNGWSGWNCRQWKQVVLWEWSAWKLLVGRLTSKFTSTAWKWMRWVEWKQWRHGCGRVVSGWLNGKFANTACNWSLSYNRKLRMGRCSDMVYVRVRQMHVYVYNYKSKSEIIQR